LSHRAVLERSCGGVSAVTARLTAGSNGRTLQVVAISVLGALCVDGDDSALGPRDRVVLEVLALRPGDVVSAERLADAMWGEVAPPTWNKVVQGCVVRLRKVLGASAIETSPAGYRLTTPADDVDAHRFERMVRRSSELLTLGEHDRAAYVSGEALALWRGPALRELEGWEAGRIEASRLDELRLDAQEVHLDANLRAGHHREVLGEAQARVAEAPLRERRWALLALAQYQAGRQGDALRTLHQARTVLVRELGVGPGPDLVALEQAILRQDPSLVAAVALPEPGATCPYRGLVPYDVEDADGFFGRDGEVETCLGRLTTIGVLAVVGPSGSGKSSLVRAGVAATLQRNGRRVVVVTPGGRPTDALTAVPSSGPAPVLVVDQCEEVVTLCDDPAERQAFFAALTGHAERGPLVIALRADRLGELSAYPDFARLVEPGLHLLSAMSDDDLRAAIEGPARQAGLVLEPGLVDLLVREVEGEPGALPLLSHALHETWQRREGRTLTVEGYRQTGGIRGAVAQSAEEVYEQVPDGQRSMLRDLLLRLVTPTPEGEPVRSRVPRRTIATDAEHEQLIELLVGARLVTSDDNTVELAHESLARAWPRLRSWLDDDVEGQRILRHLALTADAWDGMGRPDSELYRGLRLAQALEWRSRANPDLTPAERAFLDTGAERERAETRATEERARRQARQNRRLRALLAGAAALLAVAMVAGLLAVRQARRADRAAVAADARRVGAQALAANEVDRSLLLAVEGVRLDDTVDTRANLMVALARNPALIASTRGDGTAFISGEVSPDGKVVTVDGVGDTYSSRFFHAKAGRLTRAVSRVDDLQANSLVALALALGLRHADPPDLAGGPNVRTAVGLLVEADDVDDADLGHGVGDQADLRPDEILVEDGLGAREEAHLDGAVGRELLVDERLHLPREPFRERVELEVHAGFEGLHVPAGHRLAPPVPDDSAEHVQRGVGPHEPVTSIPVEGAAHLRARGRDRPLECVPDVVASLLDVDDARVADRAGVVRLSTAGRVERRLVERDGAVLDRDDARVELLEVRVAQVQQLGAQGGGACVPTLSSRNGVFLSGPGSFGRPSTRSPMMLRWISSVPP
jgi:DNA-binding SARP family transcriptional activator/energy-coupling factor transporter ATP-binding protein EcfA2